MHKQVTDAELLEHIRKLPHGRATYKQLVRELRLEGEARNSLEEALDRLCDQGAVVELRSGHYVAVGSNVEYATGRISVHRDGFGFLIPEHASEQIQGDIFLPPRETAKGMNGDAALVRITRIGDGNRAEGEIIRILRRAHITVVGEFRIRKRGNFVVPSDERIREWIQIPDGLELPRAGSSLHRVGAKQLQVSSVDDLDGMIVNLEILEFPEDGEQAVGRVIEILGHPDDFGVDVEIIIRKHHLPHEFPPEVIEQARHVRHSIASSELERRRDFRHLDIVTIDGETARDFDDAVWAGRLSNGHFALQVHIADVSHYVLPGTPIDREALLRGTSVYFPDRAVPMLPVELSTDICSLCPHEDRLVLSALLEIDGQGDIVSQEFVRGVIRSHDRMTYTNIFRVLEGDAAMRERYHKLADRFELMRELALILNRKRTRRGSIDFDMPETNIELDMSGQMIGVTRAERNIAHRIIEEFMLAANEAVAGHLETAGLPALYRIHEKPEASRVIEFEEIAAHFGYSLGVGAIPVKRFSVGDRKRDGRKARKEITIARDDLKISSRNYQRLIAKIAGKPEERILSYLMLRSLKQARYSNVNEGHFALAAAAYTHFTSPIRRYPDLVVHRILAHWIDTAQPLLEDRILNELGNDTSFTERRAAEAERELIEWKKVKFMEDRVGDDFDALIVSTTKFGFFVELIELFVEGLVPMETLSGDRFRYHENGRKIIGERSRKTYSIGDRVRVRLDRADTVERKLQFAVLEEKSAKRKHRT
ncbi:MAG: VacB/RNase II family 3'-5' exoribonuclease [Acidobacteriaceae bacterium]|nr:VacB/RNase II family 3'-5' exoribonuclease [Acidobacteriaceae bacterium]MBV9778451.1 VacB/RNase II family 3'-5' exoribonuclease [Acidobacteriaceae bacterium]